MCVGEQVPVSGAASTVGGIIFETLSLVTHTSERVSKIMAPTILYIYLFHIFGNNRYE